MNHRSVNRRTAQEQKRSSAQSGMGFAAGKSEYGVSTRSSARSFAQDFNMEHSASGAARMRVAALPDQADPANLPSCVYLG